MRRTLCGRAVQVLIVGVGITACGGFGNEEPRMGGLQQDLVGYMSRLEDSGFSGAVHVATPQGVMLHSGYGSVAGPGSAPVTDSTLFYLASVSKPFTGAAVLWAYEKGCLEPHTTVRRHFPGAPPRIGEISVQQLVGHTSGLTQYHAMAGERIDRTEAVARVLESELEAVPGTEYLYSSAGYTLLSALIDEACAVDFPTLLRQELFEPAGMTDSFVLGHGSATTLRGAHGLVDGVDIGVPAEWVGPAWAHIGGGGIVSSLRDLRRWLEAVSGCTILQQRSCTRMFERLTESAAGWYGYGWRIGESSYGGTVIYHFGSEENGHSAAIMWFPARGVRVVVLSHILEGGRVMSDRTAVALARRILEPGYSDVPFFVRPDTAR